MDSRHWGDLSSGFSQAASIARNVDFSSRGFVLEQTVTACESDLRIEHLDIEGKDTRFPVADGKSKKKRVSRIVGGGLRRFSMIVCKKVESKGRTTYSEVADEMIAEFTAPGNNSAPLDEFDEKNIRRRVYDALNVLMAINIIAKDKKEIQWRGFPSGSNNDMEELEVLHMKLKSRIERKATYLRELEEQIVGLRNLMLRNQKLHESRNVPGQGVALPFILVQTRSQATVEIEISYDSQLVHFDFNGTPFSLHDDAYILKAMRCCQVSDCGKIATNSFTRSSSGSNSGGRSPGPTHFSWNSESLNA